MYMWTEKPCPKCLYLIKPDRWHLACPECGTKPEVYRRYKQIHRGKVSSKLLACIVCIPSIILPWFYIMNNLGAHYNTIWDYQVKNITGQFIVFSANILFLAVILGRRQSQTKRISRALFPLWITSILMMIIFSYELRY